LGIANRAFVLRANINLSQLIGSATAPAADPTNGSYWFDLSATVPGLFEWSATDQAFTTIDPIYITSTSDLVGGTTTGIPKTAVGSQGDYAINTTNNTNKIYYKNSSNAWVQVGTSSWSGGTKLFQTSAHSSRPEWKTAESNAPTGSVWFKTTTPNSGADVAIKKYNSSTSAWSVVNAPLYANNHSAIYGIDSVNGGSGISAGTLYTQYNAAEQSTLGAFDNTPTLADFTVFKYEGGVTSITSKTLTPTFTNTHAISIQESLKGQSALAAAKTVTLGGTGADDFVAAISAAGFTNISATKLSTGAIKITHALGGEFRMWNVSAGTALADAGFGTSNAHDYGSYTANSATKVDNLYVAPAGYTEDSTQPAVVVATNWKRLSYTA